MSEEQARCQWLGDAANRTRDSHIDLIRSKMPEGNIGLYINGEILAFESIYKFKERVIITDTVEDVKTMLGDEGLDNETRRILTETIKSIEQDKEQL